MKKIIALLAVFALCAALCACGGNSATPTETAAPTGATAASTDNAPEVVIPFDVPEKYACILQVVTDQSVNLYLDEKDAIVAVQYLTETAKEILSPIEKDLIGADLETGAAAIVKVLAEKNVLAKGGILMLSLLNDAEGEFATTLEIAKNAFEKANTIGYKVILLGNTVPGGTEVKEDIPDDPTPTEPEGGEVPQEPVQEDIPDVPQEEIVG